LSASDQGAEISSYLQEFSQQTRLDVIIICGDQGVLAHAGELSSNAMCDSINHNRISIIDGQAWFLYVTDFDHSSTGKTRVVIGQSMGVIFEEFAEQTNLDYYLFSEGSILASNVPGEERLSAQLFSAEMEDYRVIRLDDNQGNRQRFMVGVIPLADSPEVALIGLLNSENDIALNNQLRNIVLAIFLFFSLAGIILAVVISRRISSPLNQLAQAASALREGDFSKRLSSSSKVWEIDQLANALEDARISLKHALDQLREEKLWIESLLNSIVEGIITLDHRGYVTYASEAVERLIGFSAVTLLGRPIDSFFVTSPGEDLFSHQIPAPNQNSRVLVQLNENDVLLSISASAFVPPEAGNATRALVIRDVSDEERIHRLIGEFMANITHEFRTPLAALSASVALLLEDLDSLTLPEIEQLIQALNIGVVNLQSLIDNLIEAACIEGGRFKVNPKPVDFQSILDDSIKMVEPIAIKHGLSIIKPKNKQTFSVMADKRRTSQALVNLLSNAIKHSPQGGKILVTTSILGKDVLVEVTDEGNGISSDTQNRLFRRFVRSSSEEESGQFGLGLGLSVVKAIIEAQSGVVGYRESEFGGAVFWFTIPMISEDGV
jgi:signal transduction histidine kinase